MRRTVRALSATALACAALSAAAAAASADPGAEVDPRSVEPGGLVSISVTCDAIGGSPPESIDAHSQGFEEGKVQLHRVTAADEKTGGAALYRGTARIPSGGIGGTGGTGGFGGNSGSGGIGGTGGTGGVSGVIGTSGIGGTGEHFNSGSEAGGREGEWGVDGVCPVAPGGRERSWNASYNVSHGTGTGRDTGSVTGTGRDTGRDTGRGSVTGAGRDTGSVTGAGRDTGSVTGAGRDTDTGRDTGTGTVTGAGRDTGRDTGTGSDTGTGRDTGAAHDTAELPGGVQNGVHAGEGGAFTDSVPALITGSVLIAGALGAAAYRLRHKGSSSDR